MHRHDLQCEFWCRDKIMQDKARQTPSGWQTYRRLLSYATQFWPALITAVVGFILYAITQSAFASLMQYLPSAFEASESKVAMADWEYFFGLDTSEGIRLFLPLAIITIVALRGVGSYLGGYYITFVARHVVNRLRRDLFGHLNRLPNNFFGNNNSGQLLSTMTYNVEQVASASSTSVKILIREGFTVLSLLLYILYLNWKLTLIFFIAVPLIGLIIKMASGHFKRYSHRIQNSMGGVTHVASEVIRGHAIVKAFAGEAYESARFDDRCNASMKNELKLARVNEISTPVIQMLTFSAIAILFWFGLDPDWFGETNAGAFLAYITAASLIAKPLRQLSNINASIQRGIAASESIFSILDEPPEPEQGDQDLLNSQGNMKAQSLTFHYPGSDEAALKDVSFEAGRGDIVALVGQSGAGKTTLAEIISGFQRAPANSLFYDGTCSTRLTAKSIRANVAIVTQNTVLFQDTIRANIAYGELADASDADIIVAAKKAHALEFIQNLPAGLDTQIGEDGASLSGGQRQRLSLARAFLKNAPILILDEATSALDNETELIINSAITEFAKSATVIVVAHRLTTIANATQILVMQSGTIVERGTHQALLDKRGVYFRLATSLSNETADAAS